MWFIREIAEVFWWLYEELMALALPLSAVPLMGDILSTPVAKISGWCYRIWERLLYFDGWVVSADRKLLDILSWDSIKDSIKSTWSWLDDPVANLWSGIWDKIRNTNTWLWDPVGNLWSGIWDKIMNSNTWLFDPVGNLWRGIWDEIKGTDTWLKDPSIYVNDWVKEHFIDWIWDFVEDKAEDVLKVAGKILDKVW